jgi:kumamolisin
MPRHPLAGSERQPLPGARSTGKADPDERLEAAVIVRPRAGAEMTERVKKLAAGDRSQRPLKREEFAQQFAADPADIAAVEQFAGAHGLTVVQKDPVRRTVVLSGTVAQFNDAFGVDLQQFEHDGGSYRGRTGPIHLPDELRGIVTAVMGLDNRPQARPHFRARRPHGNVQWHASAASSASFTPTELAALYGFPSGTAQGECIAIIELGGGYRTADLQKYFSELRVAPPKVASVSVDHGRNNATGDPNGPDGEVMLDIEVAGAIAPAAHIVVYFAPNTDMGFVNAVTTAIMDTKNKPSVISISWGGPESSWTQQAMTAFDQAFQAAATMGITVCVASGDNGSSDGVADGANHVDFPASSPHVLACGGTRLQASGTSIASETVWNDGANGGAGGGGVSNFFALPSYQEGLQATQTGGTPAALTMRGVPDVCGDADPESGYRVRVDGSDTVIGGTSAVAPLWAGLIARINAAKANPVGFINPHLYANPGGLRDITQGNNGSFAASPGWDACTGLGSPNGQKVADV